MAHTKYATNKNPNMPHTAGTGHVQPVKASADKAMNPGPKPGNA